MHHSRVAGTVPSMETVFLIVNNGVMPAWLLLVLAPKWRYTQLFVHTAFIPALLALAYGVLLLSAGPMPEGGSFTTLAGVTKLMQGSPAGILAAWTHYLVFDLFVGAWEARDAARLGIHHALLVPCLLLTLMLGPLGLLCWLIVRAAFKRKLSLAE